MKLTRRQEEFIANLIDLTQELEGPIHYSLLAERLGVSPFTAYDMLRLLEEKGMVVSEYQVAKGKSGPGRAERLFYPAKEKELRDQHLAEKFGELSLSHEELKQFLLEKARQGEFPEEELAREFLARVPPDGPDQVRYCVEVMTVMALRLRQHAGRQIFLTHLAQVLPDDEPIAVANLSLLGGFAFGILVQEETDDQEWSRILLEHVLQYQEIVHNLNVAEIKLLAQDLKMVFTPLTSGERAYTMNLILNKTGEEAGHSAA